MSSVKGKVVFITGGANGIGAAVGRCLHAKGAKVVLTDLDEAAAFESQIVKRAADQLPKVDAEVAALGRSLSARIEALEKR